MKRLAPLLLAVFATSPALAQSVPGDAPLPSPEEIRNRDSVTVGGGVGFVPDYEGSNDYRLIPAAAIRGTVGGISFSTRGLYLYVDVVPGGASGLDFDAGPIIGGRLNRTRKVKDDIVDLLPERKTAIEAGGFAGISFHGLTNPYDTLGLRLDAVHDIAGAHKSTTFSPNLDFSTPLSRSTYVSASVGAEFVGNKFADYYYSITPADSLATAGALPVFDADGGMKNWKASLLLNQSLSGDLLRGVSLFGTAGYSRLVGDFKRAPIVSQRGSANQWLLAAGLAYTF
jgi:outer membrane scaffolding protein for murein synthesis (MipA/OmpV family)